MANAKRKTYIGRTVPGLKVFVTTQGVLVTEDISGGIKVTLDLDEALGLAQHLIHAVLVAEESPEGR